MYLRQAMIIVVTVTTMLLSGCGAFCHDEQFKLISSPSGDLYRLQVTTGQVHKIAGATLVSVTDVGRLQLQVGSIYLFEDGNPMKYLGGGKFEPFSSEVLTLEEYLKKQGAKENLEGYIKSQTDKK